MQYKAILFDMDGTLLPMDMDTFINGYFVLLAKKLAPLNIDKKALTAAIWEGTGAMVVNDGAMRNDERFWARFEQHTGISRETADPLCLDFYANEFHGAKAFTDENPLAVQAVRIAAEKAEKVALATNPLFPMAGQKTRMSFVGLEPEMFCLVTSYESDSYCKPNPAYFADVCRRIGVEPKDCLMIGNDERDDMMAASSLGMDCYLVTDWIVPSEKHPWNGRRGTFAEMVEFLKAL